MNSTRRSFLRTASGGFGAFAMADVLAAASLRKSHFPGKAKHVIFLFMTGGPSQIDLFDPKPALRKHAGQRPSTVNLRTERVTGGILPSTFEFQRMGRNGVEVSELIPQLGKVIDDICVLRSVYTFNPTHTPARNLMHTGTIVSTRPAMGSWLSYGLGTENRDLPGFVLLSPSQGSQFSRSAFLPAEHQGTHFSMTETDPEKMIRYVRNPSLQPKSQRAQLDLVQALNQTHRDSFGADEFLEGRIQAMETAYRMQFAATDVFDVRKEPESVRAEYGTSQYGNSCLLARRLVERGVRYVHVYYGAGQVWDDHTDIEKNLRKRCPDMDQASAALLRDLKRRGLLDETLVVWGGEFGRTPVSENGAGRDHNPYGFTMWMAGGGVKGGIAYGATDEFGFQAVENRVSVHDVHATILHQMGVDHEKLTYRYAGRDFRLTDVHGQIVKDVLA